MPAYMRSKKPSQAELLIVNTCGFIESARQESYRVLKNLAHKKRRGQLLIATGCLTQRYQQKVAEIVPGIDGMLGTRRWMDIIDLIGKVNSSHTNNHSKLAFATSLMFLRWVKNEKEVMRYSIHGASAYLKIADGCRRTCAFCAISTHQRHSYQPDNETILRDAAVLETTRHPRNGPDLHRILPIMDMIWDWRMG